MKMFKKEDNIVVFANANMGDFVWATSAIYLIKQYNKNINITLVTSKSFVDLIDKKFFKKVITTNPKYHLNKNKFIRLFYKIYWLIKNYFSLKFNSLFFFLDISSFMAFSAKKILKIKNIVGPEILWFGYDCKNIDSKYYTVKIPLPKNQDKVHIMIRYQLLVRYMFPTYNLSIPKISDTCLLSNKFEEQYLKNTKKYKIALCTSGSGEIKNWNINNFNKLIKLINKSFNSTFYVVGNSLKEIENGKFLVQENKDVDIRNLCGKTSLLELKTFLKDIDLLISVDTGVIHLAAIYNIPTISLHGWAIPEKSMPINKNAVPMCAYRECSVRCSYNFFIGQGDKECLKNPKCMQDITPEIVFEKVKEIL